MRSLAFGLPLLLLAACTADQGEPAPAEAGRKVAGYFTEWGVYDRNFQVKDVAADRLTHLKYAFATVDGGKCAVGDDWAAHERPIDAAGSVDGVADAPDAPVKGNIGQLKKLKAKYPQLKVLWSVGGWTGSEGFSDAAKDPAAFAESCRALLGDQRWAGVFDGIDVDWEYPNACGLSCDTSGPDALPGLLTALREALGDQAVITAAVPGDVGKLDKTDYVAAAAIADHLGAMTYDYFGTGNSKGPTAPHSALSSYPGIPRETATATATVDKLLAMGVPPEKVLLGVGFYGRGWAGVTQGEPGGTGTGAARGDGEQNLENYRTLAERCPPSGEVGGQAYASCGSQWWAYDTPETIAAKVAYADEKGLGGAFAWELSGDADGAPLLTALAGR